MMRFQRRRRSSVGKTMLSGLLSVTTAGLLTPLSLPKAWAYDHAREETSMDDVPHTDEVDALDLRWEDAPRLGEEELVSGTAERAACYQSGQLRLAWHATNASDSYQATLCLNGEWYELGVFNRMGGEGVCEAMFSVEDGLYDQLDVRVEGAAGDVLESSFEHVLVDTTEPRYCAAWNTSEEGRVLDGVAYYPDRRTLTIVVEEPNPDDGLVAVVNAERVVAESDGMTHVYTIECVDDGEYEVALEGTDAFGRVPQREPQSLLLPMRFVVDGTAPVVRVLYDGVELDDAILHEGRLYASSRPHISVEVRDKNLDVTSLRIGGQSLDSWEIEGDTVTIELPEDMPLDEPLRITGADLAGNALSGAEWVAPVVVDDQAPLVEVEPMSPTADATNLDGTGLFFSKETSVELHLTDDKGLAEVVVEPHDACVMTPDRIEPGSCDVWVSLLLPEGRELTREVTVTAYDLAGNWRSWSLDTWGTTSEAGKRRVSENAAVCHDDAGAPVFPLFLLQDTTPPVVKVEGIDDGGSYDTYPLVRVSVDESSFSHLLSYDGSDYADQCVFVVSERESYEGVARAGNVEELCVRDFELNALSGRWEATKRITREGFFTARAQLVDVAGNVSRPWECDIVVDVTPPTCDVAFVCDDVHVEEHEGMFYRAPRKAKVRIRERNWDELQSLDVRYTNEDGSVQRLSASDFVEEGEDWHVCTVDFARDGMYQLLCDATDVAGNVMDTCRTPAFVVDLTNPRVEVVYDGDKGERGRYYRTPRTATIKVIEHNWAGDDSCVVEVVAQKTASEQLPRATAWSVPDPSRPDEHVCTVSFVQDARYALRVSGHDKSLRTLQHEGNEGFADEFVVDAERPTIQVDFAPSSYTEYEGVMYLRHALDVPVSVRDRNLDVTQTMLKWDGLTLPFDRDDFWEVDDSDQTGEKTWSHTLRFGQGFHVSPSIAAVDLAGNTASASGKPFVVDLEAPTLISVTTSSDPSAAYEYEVPGERGELQVFDRPTQLVFEVEDQYLLEGAFLDDPDGQYRLESNVERGSAKGRAVVSLVDGLDSHDEESFDRNIVFGVFDMAGNQHSWTLDRRGNVVADAVGQGTDPTLNGKGSHPLALVQDTLPPTIAIEGIEPGVITRQTQIAKVDIHEFNFSYLRLLRPRDAVVRITARDATPQRETRIEEVAVSSFEGADPTWSFVKEFSADGHYAMEASFTDMAGHASNRVVLGEFTVDKTPPSITVSWDHELQEAHTYGGRHYFATTRCATIAVREHNFRAEDITIDAGLEGVASAWREVGDDTHECTVSYQREAKDCRLVVAGKDQAGNEARSYEQRNFVIDLTPPIARILNVVGPHGERAFADGVEPVIAFDDGERGNFDAGPQGWSYRISGKRADNVAERGDSSRFGQEECFSETEALVTFGDLGALQQEFAGYDVSYDDVYTITAWARDLAGNESQPASATFSVNRFGSNFFVERVDGLYEGSYDPDDASAVVRPLAEAPRIVVHEVNVSGAESPSDHRVMRDYANAVTELTQDGDDEQHGESEQGYCLKASGEASPYNEHAGWSEYVYTIRKGNFGEDALGQGDGQGRYRVNVSSVDSAQNFNTTSRYWASDARRAQAVDKSATVVFTLDELAPTIEHLDVGPGVVLGGECLASFRVTDDISCGDTIEVLLDGEPTRVVSAGSGETVDTCDAGTGTYAFVIPARSFVPHTVSIRVSDYAGRSVTCGASVLVTSLVPEALVVVGVIGAGALVCIVIQRRRDGMEPTYPHAA